MKINLLELLELHSPRSGCKLELKIFELIDDEVIEGVLSDDKGNWYPIIEGVPIILDGPMRPDHSEFLIKHGLSEGFSLSDIEIKDQRTDLDLKKIETRETFSDKWKRFKNYGMSESHRKFLYEWYCKKLGVANESELRSFYKSKKLILECGPGSGFNSHFMSEASSGNVLALDISDAAFTTFENTAGLDNCHVVQADLMYAPISDDSFDFIIADGVLHHTPDTRAAVETLYRKLIPGGQFFFYIYRRMGAARYNSDKHIRDYIMQLNPTDAYKACEPLTELGRELSQLNAKITLEKPIKPLGIPAGTYDVQRLVYYHFVKCFWNDAFDFETNNMVNYDWYHPQHAWQHTEEEVMDWLSGLGVQDFKINDANPNGISVLLTKPIA